MNAFRFVNNVLALVLSGFILTLFSIYIWAVLTPLSLLLNPRMFLETKEEALDHVVRGSALRQQYKHNLINRFWK